MSNSSSSHLVYQCTDNYSAILISCSWTIVKCILVGPLATAVLYMAYHQWRPTLSFRTTTHSDFFTYHMSMMELIGATGGFFYCWGVFLKVDSVLLLGVFVSLFGIPGQVYMQCLTCLDRYVAVVHPITFLKLRQRNGIILRNICVIIVWLLCIGSMGVQWLSLPVFPIIPFACLLILAFFLVSYFSVAVMCVLVRPGPRDIDTDRVENSKRRAFNTIIAIWAVLCFWFVGFFISLQMYVYPTSKYASDCVVFMAGLWFNIPSSLVLPVLFLKRTGKLKCSR